MNFGKEVIICIKVKKFMANFVPENLSNYLVFLNFKKSCVTYNAGCWTNSKSYLNDLEVLVD